MGRDRDSKSRQNGVLAVLTVTAFLTGGYLAPAQPASASVSGSQSITGRPGHGLSLTPPATLNLDPGAPAGGAGRLSLSTLSIGALSVRVSSSTWDGAAVASADGSRSRPLELLTEIGQRTLTGAGAELFPASLEVGSAAIYEFALHPDFEPGDQRDRYSLELVIDCAEAF